MRWKTVIGSKQANSARHDVSKYCPTIVAAMGGGGGFVPMLTNVPLRYTKEEWFLRIIRKWNMKAEEFDGIELPAELRGKEIRIRKTTPRENFRLMGVPDREIDKLQAYRYRGEDGDLTDCKGNAIYDIEAKSPKVWKMHKGEKISKSQQYKLAGNSITTSPMVQMFENLLIDPTYIAKSAQQDNRTKEPCYEIETDGQLSFF